MTYNWQQVDWPRFRYDLAGMERLFLEFTEKSGALRGLMAGIETESCEHHEVNDLVVEAVSTSAIEGERLSYEEVMSSICNQLGRNLPPVPVHDHRAEGVAALILDVRKHYAAPLEKSTLLRWHRILFENWASRALTVGAFRTHIEPMRVITNRPEADEIRFEAPPSSRVPTEMARFVRWFNATAPGAPKALAFSPVRAAITHLYFESVHPFEDGNGRIGRALVGKVLAQHFGAPVLLPLSATLNKQRKAYYAALHQASLTNDVTEWIRFFTSMLLQSVSEVENELLFLLQKIHFFSQFTPLLNPRQACVLDRMAREGRKGFVGGMTAAKYQAIAKTSKATATRDLAELLVWGALTRTGAGPGIRYDLPFVAQTGR